MILSNPHGKIVSWMRKRDLHILTSNIYTYTGDQRFSVIHPPDSDDWDLKIEYAQQKDSGIYECQVNTEPKINLAVYLDVTGQ
ncbi:AGAP001201-PA-like protein [Anopheles sinensis]|uniref:AGAP001201-PA-like protein n=4 Tax=Anopheles TaxID=7164 RepID=A0A084W0C0_ANOSI|nr:AGAP001201-PA-like protein [Anopheles sinensis]